MIKEKEPIMQMTQERRCDMIDCQWYGLETRHEPGEVFDHPGWPRWLLMRFRTPFVYLADGALHRGEAGQLLLHPPHTCLHHGPTPEMTEGFCNDWLYFAGGDADAILAEFALPCNQAFSVGDASFMLRALEQMERERRTRAAGDRYMLSGLVTAMLVELGRAWAQANIKNAPSYDAVEATRTAMFDRCEHPWTLGELARLSGYSVSQYCKLYRHYFGIAPIDDLLHQRILRAKQLLFTGTYTVTEISALCGFSSIHYFSTTFKRIEGCSPSQFLMR